MEPMNSNNSDYAWYFVAASSIWSVVMIFMLFLCVAAHLDRSTPYAADRPMNSPGISQNTAIARVDSSRGYLEYEIWPK